MLLRPVALAVAIYGWLEEHTRVSRTRTKWSFPLIHPPRLQIPPNEALLKLTWNSYIEESGCWSLQINLYIWPPHQSGTLVSTIQKFESLHENHCHLFLFCCLPISCLKSLNSTKVEERKTTTHTFSSPDNFVGLYHIWPWFFFHKLKMDFSLKDQMVSQSFYISFSPVI